MNMCSTSRFNKVLFGAGAIFFGSSHGLNLNYELISTFSHNTENADASASALVQPDSYRQPVGLGLGEKLSRWSARKIGTAALSLPLSVVAEVIAQTSRALAIVGMVITGILFVIGSLPIIDCFSLKIGEYELNLQTLAIFFGVFAINLPAALIGGVGLIVAVGSAVLDGDWQQVEKIQENVMENNGDGLKVVSDFVVPSSLKPDEKSNYSTFAETISPLAQQLSEFFDSSKKDVLTMVPLPPKAVDGNWLKLESVGKKNIVIVNPSGSSSMRLQAITPQHLFSIHPAAAESFRAQFPAPELVSMPSASGEFWGDHENNWQPNLNTYTYNLICNGKRTERRYRSIREVHDTFSTHADDYYEKHGKHFPSKTLSRHMKKGEKRYETRKAQLNNWLKSLKRDQKLFTAFSLEICPTRFVIMPTENLFDVDMGISLLAGKKYEVRQYHNKSIEVFSTFLDDDYYGAAGEEQQKAVEKWNEKLSRGQFLGGDLKTFREFLASLGEPTQEERSGLKAWEDARDKIVDDEKKKQFERRTQPLVGVLFAFSSYTTGITENAGAVAFN